MSLVTPDNKEPIEVTAERIGRAASTARKLCAAGKLAHLRDATGRIWSSAEAADAFLGYERGRRPTWSNAEGQP